MLLQDKIDAVPGVGEKRAQLLNTMGIFTVKDLIEYFPRDYDDRSQVKKVAELLCGEANTLIGKVTGEADNLFRSGKVVTRLTIKDDTGRLELIWFGQSYMKNNLKKGQEYIFTGKVTERAGRFQMVSPEYEAMDGSELLSNGRIIPVYPLVKKISQKILRGLIKSCLDATRDQFDDFFDPDFCRRHDLCPRCFAIQNIHFPGSDQDFFQARRRLVFEELFLMQASLFRTKLYTGREEGIAFSRLDTVPFRQRLSFSLTTAQERVLEEIREDLSKDKPMNRLIQGDVGSGKTAVAMEAIYLSAQNGCQSAMMAPTEVLARQHYETMSLFFGQIGMETVLLLSGQTKGERQAVLEKIETGEAQVIVGTHAMIQEKVRFHRLGLSITDEQHRFGVSQRFRLAEKGSHPVKPHVLVMTATPIPRTLGLILYGDMDVSVIDQLPPGRQAIETFCVDSSYRQRILAFIQKQIDAGRQAYIICPAIEENEKTGLQSVKAYTAEIQSFFGGVRLCCLHGKQKPGEKKEIMEGFAAGEVKILVATTVIEVGINVPNATVMLIENADRFGLAQLHQLRGRVGRGAEKSYCVLISDGRSALTKKRMETMAKTNDGFAISEMDLQLRGPGDFFGTRQHGLPEFKIANLYKDMDVLKEAQQAAKILFEQGNSLGLAMEREMEEMLRRSTAGTL